MNSGLDGIGGWKEGERASSHEVLRLPDGGDVIGVDERPEPLRHLLRGC